MCPTKNYTSQALWERRTRHMHLLMFRRLAFYKVSYVWFFQNVRNLRRVSPLLERKRWSSLTDNVAICFTRTHICHTSQRKRQTFHQHFVCDVNPMKTDPFAMQYELKHSCIYYINVGRRRHDCCWRHNGNTPIRHSYPLPQTS